MHFLCTHGGRWLIISTALNPNKNDNSALINRTEDVKSHHLVLRLGVDAHHAQVAIGYSLVIRVFVKKGLHILNIHSS